MNNTPWLGVHLLELDLVRGDRCTGSVENEEARARCTLVY